MVRKSPTESATSYKLGTRKRGNDGNMWEIIFNKNGVKRWKKDAKKTSNKREGYKIKTIRYIVPVMVPILARPCSQEAPTRKFFRRLKQRADRSKNFRSKRLHQDGGWGTRNALLLTRFRLDNRISSGTLE